MRKNFNSTGRSKDGPASSNKFLTNSAATIEINVSQARRPRPWSQVDWLTWTIENIIDLRDLLSIIELVQRCRSDMTRKKLQTWCWPLQLQISAYNSKTWTWRRRTSPIRTLPLGKKRKSSKCSRMKAWPASLVVLLRKLVWRRHAINRNSAPCRKAYHRHQKNGNTKSWWWMKTTFRRMIGLLRSRNRPKQVKWRTRWPWLRSLDLQVQLRSSLKRRSWQLETYSTRREHNGKKSWR